MGRIVMMDVLVGCVRPRRFGCEKLGVLVVIAV
jgi:hypothetical protein